MNVDYPYNFDDRGRTSSVDDEGHIRDLIEAVLFTTPGERVNRPSFGSGLLQLLFAPTSEALAAATQLTVQSSLQQWLGDLIEVQGVEVISENSTLRVQVQYVIRRIRESRTSSFTRNF